MRAKSALSIATRSEIRTFAPGGMCRACFGFKHDGRILRRNWLNEVARA